jgi:acyl dehydratase/NAD(P)-dependent dehydrogenase (short-subunit alcohol dehydrogenase family)
MRPSRTFTLNDQLKFAALTGDFNPLHIDPVSARRTHAGAPVVHGIHTLLWLLDSLAHENPDLPPIAGMKVRFARLIYVGDQVEAVVTERGASELRAEVTIDGIPSLQLVLAFGAVVSDPATTIRGAAPLPRPTIPLESSLGEMASSSGVLAFASTPDDMERIFPHAARLLGARRLAALGCSTLLVGMVIPGLHSLYTGLRVTICEEKQIADSIAFRVARVDPRVRLVEVEICGGGLSGSLSTFVRHPPIAQASIKTVASLVSRDEFASVTAFIIGGSRGLGELTAKIIAAGGGNSIVTYAVGKADAEALTTEITASGGKCKAIRYDVREDAQQQLSAITSAPTHICYFATPAIFRGKPGVFSQRLFDEFNEFYISGFYRLIDASLKHWPEGFSVFCPSSVAVEERPDGMTEYSMSKAAAEILCADIRKQVPQARISVSRLPRLLTDQTATLRSATADSVAIMLPLIRDFLR